VAPSVENVALLLGISI